ncbi:AraC family transcriptional regulator [Runella slithyformis]|uniref:Transcriptional regulator with cupin sensor, AraC family n=1 Tax=Runella slithyformis (strain ATCC 29530 / DSM 19594 / LMG 11500 / NCIMB 11436 / LSU 4) TaxID=761193 RepID=A0A7U3ZIA1_RUNSL|nr:AraC family transcriptional regulator [Runella slithyformis]AEI47747.1 transcriptional regulator with cupin sensor, AraC family [Runella slithyformis DSM 19594]
MRAPLRKELNVPSASFTTIELLESHFDPNWHFHPHYQLFTVLEGTGTRFVGDDIRHFEAGDTVFLGPNIPHLWRSDRAYFEGNPELKTHGIVVYFTEDFLGEGFFDKPEMHVLKQLLDKGLRGLDIVGAARRMVQNSLKKLAVSQGFEAVLALLSTLHQLSHTSEVEYITGVGYVNTYKVSETERMQRVYEYVMKHFKEEIRLQEVSALANMTEAAFCRYFKSRANKTFSDFVSEIRIAYACKLLVQEKYSVTQICYESGFNTVSNFNRQFKNLTGKSPLQYQKVYMQRGE